MDYRGQFLKVSFHWWRSRSRKSASDLVKIENRSRKPDVFGFGRIRTVLLSLDSAYGSDAHELITTRLSASQAEAEESTNHNAGSFLLESRERLYIGLFPGHPIVYDSRSDITVVLDRRRCHQYLSSGSVGLIYHQIVSLALQITTPTSS